MKHNHIENVTVKAVFSDCAQFRYRLAIRKNDAEGDKTVCVIMLNPSIANEERADKSTQFLENLVFLKGYSELKEVAQIIIVNQFAYVQTNDFNGSTKHIGKENDAHVSSAIKESEIVLVAWGLTNGYAERKAIINSMISSHGSSLVLATKMHPGARASTYVDFIKPYNSSNS